MEVESILHTEGGTSRGSYYEFSKSLQSNVNEFFWPKLARHIAQYTDANLPTNSCIVVADFGCACAWSTVRSLHFTAKCIAGPHVSDDPNRHLHIQAFFNDLPSNDFNTLFSLLSSPSSEHLLQANKPPGLNFIPCGLPGTFYSRLFPPGYLHIGLCTLALHNLSMVPRAVQDRNSPSWNENGMWILEGCKTETALEYKKQFAEDFLCFLHHRSQELAPGGLLFCVMIASKGNTLHSLDSNRLYTNLQSTWRQLISEGLLEKNSLDTFNLPCFKPTIDEVKEVLSTSGIETEFKVAELEYVELERAPKEVWAMADWGSTCETMARNFVGSLIEAHLGHEKYEMLMERFKSLADVDDESRRDFVMHLIVLALSRRST